MRWTPSDAPRNNMRPLQGPIAFAIVVFLTAASAALGGSVDRGDIERNKGGRAVTATIFPPRTLSVSIERSPGDVYAFASDPENLPKWAKGLGKSVRKHGSDWIVETPQGPMKVRFAGKNALGVLDHYVTTPSGMEVYVPMRVLPNGTGSEVLVTLFRLPDMSDEKYADDLRLVDRDLRTLKDLLEK